MVLSVSSPAILAEVPRHLAEAGIDISPMGEAIAAALG
jgi:hypothetical protein